MSPPPPFPAETLHSNLVAVQDTFEIKRFAVFDQFPWTHHIESGVYLQKRAIEKPAPEEQRKRKAEELDA